MVNAFNFRPNIAGAPAFVVIMNFRLSSADPTRYQGDVVAFTDTTALRLPCLRLRRPLVNDFKVGVWVQFFGHDGSFSASCLFLSMAL